MSLAINLIEGIGRYAVHLWATAWGPLQLLISTIIRIGHQLANRKIRWHETMDQMYAIGAQSLPVILFSLVFTSFMLITEFSFHMKLVIRQDSLVPAFSTVLMVRELGPVLTGLLLMSRVGAGIAAEIGTMRVTEQIDALRLLAIDPVEYLTLPRWIAALFSTVSLSVVALGVAILGGALLASHTMDTPLAQYFNTMFLFIRLSDFRDCLLKSIVFGTIIPMVASYHGFHCRLGSEGVGNAATAAVVQGSLMIIVADFVLTFLLYAI